MAYALRSMCCAGKTGFFLDQRDNRKRVENLSKGKTVLNVFSYTGGFSLYAARGGATEVTSLDASRPALAAAQRNFALNPQINCPHKVLCGDAFAEMKALIDAEKSYDVVVIDPPSFARKIGGGVGEKRLWAPDQTWARVACARRNLGAGVVFESHQHGRLCCHQPTPQAR